MPFDKQKFLITQFTAREESVPVPAMKEFFPEGEDPVWKIRGLEGVEVARAREAKERNKNIAAIIKGLIAANEKEKMDAIQKLVGVGEKVTDDLAWRMELFIIGSVDPKVDLELTKKIVKAYSVQFYTITNEIISLTGDGYIPGKAKASGEIQKLD